MIAIVLIIAIAVCYITTTICYTINKQFIDDYSEVMTSPYYIELEEKNYKLEGKLDQAKTICALTRESIKKTNDIQNKQALYDLALTKIINL